MSRNTPCTSQARAADYSIALRIPPGQDQYLEEWKDWNAFSLINFVIDKFYLFLRGIVFWKMKGMDHYVFIKDNGKAQVVYEEGRWVTEHIRTAILKYNYEIDKIDKLLIKDFTDEELNEYEKTS